MSKALVINGQHRSGTNMLARLIGSQPNIICMTGIFEMLKIIASMRGVGDKNVIVRENFEASPNVFTEKSHHILRSKLLDSYAGEILAMVAHPHYVGDGSDKVYGLTLNELFAAIPVIANHEPVNDLGGLMSAVGEKLGIKVFGSKWASGHNYANTFLKSPDAYWLEIIRNPYAVRASEELRGGPKTWSNLKDHEDALKFAKSFKHERMLVIRYEDLCIETEKTTAEISAWLGETIKPTELTNPRGGKFVPMTSYHRLDGNSHEIQDQSMSNEIGSLDLERWRKTYTARDMAFLNAAVDFHGLYEKEPVDAASRAYAASRMAKMQAINAVRPIVRGAFNLAGFDIYRSPPKVTI
tara:strand:- start:1595 stop:2656 length:1062 start_codon:yes stop_codon:yes gene_type:complete